MSACIKCKKPSAQHSFQLLDGRGEYGAFCKIACYEKFVKKRGLGRGNIHIWFPDKVKAQNM